MANQKVMLLGIDGATWSLIKPWIQEKKLPGFAKLVANGTHAPLESTTPPLSPPAWNSIYTGTNPGKHNIFGFVKRKQKSYFITPISSKDRMATPIWRIISDCGKRCVLLNIPFSYPPDPVNGIMTTGLGTPSRNSEFVYPAHYRKKILKKFPSFDVDYNEDLIFLGTNKDPLEQIKKITHAQSRLAKHLFETERWDFFSVVFLSTDVIQHYYWNDGEAVLDCYKQMDDFLKWTLENLGRDTILLVCSDHGFEPVHTSANMNNWLCEKGFLSIKKKKGKGIKRILPSAETLQIWLLKLGLRNLVSRLKRSKIIEPVVRRLIPSKRVQHLCDIEWRKSDIYFREGSFGMLNVNLKGREPEGKVERSELEKVRDKLIREALKWKDPRTGNKVILEGYPGDEVYHGDSKNIPDMVLIRNDGYKLQGGYDRHGKLFEEERVRIGDHAKYGILSAYGRGIEKKKELKGAKVYDLAPTILYLLGISVPEEMDGYVLREMFGEKFMKSRTGKEITVSDTDPKNTSGIDERSVVKDHVAKLILGGDI